MDESGKAVVMFPARAPSTPRSDAASVQTRARIAAIEAEIDQLQAEAAPAPPEVLKDAVRMILTELYIRPDEQQAQVDKWVIALQEFPANVITEVVTDWLREKLLPRNDEEKRWTPRKLIVRRCQERLQPLRGRISRARERIGRLSLPPPSTPPPEERERVLAKQAALSGIIQDTIRAARPLRRPDVLPERDIEAAVRLVDVMRADPEIPLLVERLLPLLANERIRAELQGLIVRASGVDDRPPADVEPAV